MIDQNNEVNYGENFTNENVFHISNLIGDERYGECQQSEEDDNSQEKMGEMSIPEQTFNKNHLQIKYIFIENIGNNNELNNNNNITKTKIEKTCCKTFQASNNNLDSNDDGVGEDDKRLFITSKNFYGENDKDDNKKLDKTTEPCHKKKSKKLFKITKKPKIKNSLGVKTKKIIKIKKIKKLPVIKTRFITARISSLKFGNNLKTDRRLRKQNIKDKMVRNLIQTIFPFWITGSIPKKTQKIKREELVKLISKPGYNQYKICKLSEIYKDKIDSFYFLSNDITKIKLEFTFKEAFSCFVDKNLRKDILSTVLIRSNIVDEDLSNYDDKMDFERLDHKDSYLSVSAKDNNELGKIENFVTELINDFEIYKSAI